MFQFKHSIVLILLCFSFAQGQIMKGEGSCSFSSTAKAETITAGDGRVLGVLNLGTGNFSFSVRVDSFNGFNSDLQQKHFNDQYMESSKYPYVRYYGTLEQIPPKGTDGVYVANGTIDLHGIQAEKSIPVTFEWLGGRVQIVAEFELSPNDFGITIPKTLTDKIGKTIAVTVNAKLR